MGFENSDFNPMLAKIIGALESDPKQFPKKSGNLGRVRAAATRFGGTPWRVAFTIDEKERIVVILAIGKHDEAYRDASR